MNVLEALATAFINTFGITQPTDKTRRRAAWFIMGLMTLTLILVVAVGMFLLRIL
jgi:hypothetical protein